MITRNQVKVGDILQLDNSPISVNVVTRLEKDKLLCTMYWWDGHSRDNFIFYSSLECRNYKVLSKEEFNTFASSLVENKKRDYENYKNGVSKWMEEVSGKVKMGKGE